MTPELAFTRLAGDETANRVLVVGPSLGTSVTALWSACARLLAPDLDVVGWDLPGHGHSKPAGDAFSVADLADLVRDRADLLAAGRPAWYAGVSLGGAVGLQLSLAPGPFLGTAAIASAPRLADPQSWVDRADLVRRAGTPVMVGPSSVRWFAAGFTDRDPEAAGALLTSLSEADAGSYALACLALRDFDLSDHLAAATVPVLVAPGEHDVVVAPEHADAATTRIPDRTFVVLTGCGHLPPAEAPDDVAAVLRRFATTRRNP
ncbi:alpha/beta fold hydrolase [Nocardioides guangzhouensis]|uniref:Alpha/beta fold hydrolase n=1 Tax=Nocardioides guangzhouensis TaxID=2497878 RepID=A0A4Q4Z837_9ACTN|nr:alpha/beta hydrolase [Nocardioides guangzhouensis]RYP84030.1 alpha/beta fold hydrolase [Nocardioides guangzhouensis]